MAKRFLESEPIKSTHTLIIGAIALVVGIFFFSEFQLVIEQLETSLFVTCFNNNVYDAINNVFSTSFNAFNLLTISLIVIAVVAILVILIGRLGEGGGSKVLPFAGITPRTIFLLISIFAMLIPSLFFVTPVIADLNSNNLQICDPSYSQSIMIPLYVSNPISYVILPSSACGGISGAWYIYQDHVNFTNTRFGSLGNPIHTFGVGVQNANVTVTDTNPVSQNSIFYNLNCVKGNTVYASLYLPKGYVLNYVTLTSGSDSNTIDFNHFITSLSTFNLAPAPAVFYDKTNGILKAKVVCDPTTIQWNMLPVCGSVIVFAYSDIEKQKNEIIKAKKLKLW